MENKLIMTYGLNAHQNEILSEKFSNEHYSDVTGHFTDLIAVPAAAIVINSDALTEEEKSDLNKAFDGEYDTCISVFGSWDTMDMNFFHIGEKDPEHFEETIKAIKRRLSIKEDYDKASKRMNDAIAGVTRIIKADAKGSFRDQIIHMNSYSQPYEELTKILDHIQTIPGSKKVKYKDELNSVLYAVMIAHGLIRISDIDDDKDIQEYPELCLDREWIGEMAETIRTHYEKRIME